MAEEELEKLSVRCDTAMDPLIRNPFAVQQRLVQPEQGP